MEMVLKLVFECGTMIMEKNFFAMNLLIDYHKKKIDVK